MATEVLRGLLRQELDEGGVHYWDAPTDLIEVYENAAHPIPDAPPAAVLAMLMESNRITGTELAKKTGIAHSTISAVLHGDRKLTAEHIRKRATHFNVSAAAFFSTGDILHSVTGSGGRVASVSEVWREPAPGSEPLSR